MFDKQVARDRMKRRMISERIKNGYKYRDPSKLPKDESVRPPQAAPRPAPFAAQGLLGR